MLNLQAFLRKRKTGKGLPLDQGASCRFFPCVSNTTLMSNEKHGFSAHVKVRVPRLNRDLFERARLENDSIDQYYSQCLCVGMAGSHVSRHVHHHQKLREIEDALSFSRLYYLTHLPYSVLSADERACIGISPHPLPTQVEFLFRRFSDITHEYTEFRAGEHAWYPQSERLCFVRFHSQLTIVLKCSSKSKQHTYNNAERLPSNTQFWDAYGAGLLPSDP